MAGLRKIGENTVAETVEKTEVYERAAVVEKLATLDRQRVELNAKFDTEIKRLSVILDTMNEK